MNGEENKDENCIKADRKLAAGLRAFGHRFKSAVKKTYELPLWKWLILCFVLSLLEELLLEMFGRHSLIAPFVFIFYNPVIYLYNVAIIFLTLTIALLFRRRAFMMCLVMLAWFVVGFVNFIVLGYRITPFSAIDFLMVSDAFSMMNIYFNLFQRILIFVGLGIVVMLISYMFIKIPKIKGHINYVSNVIVCLITFIIVYSFTIFAAENSIITDKFTNLGTAYKNYGFVYCFTNSVMDVGIGKPDSYTEETMRELYDEVFAAEAEPTVEPKIVSHEDTPDTVELRTPDIIIIQLESFIDISRATGISTDVDSVPNFNKFMEEYPSGYLTVPAIGAGTANTEFEILTGMSSKLFGAGEYPYKTVLTETACESMAQLLLRQGYRTHAIHNNKAKFYSRDETYKSLGFDSFTSIEYILNLTRTETGWAKDECLPEEIFKALDSDDESDLVFTVSVQGHGRYPTEDKVTDKHVTVTLESDEYGETDEELTYQFEYYVNQCYEMDKMIAELKRMLDERGEDYVLFLYGDHIPSLTFDEVQITEGTEMQTEYVIISNFDMGLEDKDLYSYEVSDYLMTALGLDRGVMQKLHQLYFDPDELTEEYLAASQLSDEDEYEDDTASDDVSAASGSAGSGDSTSVSESETDEDTSEKLTYMDRCQLVQYDMLYGERYIYDYIDEYTATDMRLGIYDVVLDSMDYNSSGNLIVKGENFTEFSKVLINEERYETVYVDNQTIMVMNEEIGEEPLPGDVICVAQIDKNKHELSRTEEVPYAAP